MKIVDIRLIGLAGGTVEGGWADELTPDEDINAIVEIVTDEGLIGVGSAMTSKALVEGAVRLPPNVPFGQPQRNGIAHRPENEAA